MAFLSILLYCLTMIFDHQLSLVVEDSLICLKKPSKHCKIKPLITAHLLIVQTKSLQPLSNLLNEFAKSVERKYLFRSFLIIPTLCKVLKTLE